MYVGGHGLGLYICKNLVELMNGSISVKSERYSGTTISLTIQCKKYVESNDTNIINNNTTDTSNTNNDNDNNNNNNNDTNNINTGIVPLDQSCTLSNSTSLSSIPSSLDKRNILVVCYSFNIL